jgi:hypothetical protein
MARPQVGNATHASASRATGVARSCRSQSVFHDQRIDERAGRRIDIRDGQVLVRREPEVTAMDAGNLAQSGLVRAPRQCRGCVPLDAQGEVPAAVETVCPAEAIAL